MNTIGAVKLMMVALVVFALLGLAVAMLDDPVVTHADWNAQCIYEHGAGTDAYYICLAEVPGW